MKIRSRLPVPFLSHVSFVLPMLLLCSLRPATAVEPEPEADLRFDQKPVPLRVAKPYYPKEARKQELQAVVVLAVVISERGVVEEVAVVQSGGAIFDEAAMASLFDWVFEPAELGGVPVRATITQPIDFKLQGSDRATTVAAVAIEEPRYVTREEFFRTHDVKTPEFIDAGRPGERSSTSGADRDPGPPHVPVLQAALNVPKMQEHWRGDASPLIVAANRQLRQFGRPENIPLEMFGAPVEWVPEKELAEGAVHVRFRRVAIAEDKATVDYDYLPDGVHCTVMLELKGGVWTVKKASVKD